MAVLGRSPLGRGPLSTGFAPTSSPIDFPYNPSDGQVFTAGGGRWVYDGALRAWNAVKDGPFADTETSMGDMVYASAPFTPARLAKGTTGYPIVAGATIPGYAQLGTVGIADGAVTNAKVGGTLVKLTRTTGQTLPTTTVTDITWENETADVDGFHAASSASVIVPSGLAGMYLVGARVTVAANWIDYIALRFTGVNTDIDFIPGGSSLSCNVGAVVHLAVGDGVKVSVQQFSGSTTMTGTFFMRRLMV